MEVMSQEDYDAWFKENTPALTEDKEPEGVATAEENS